MPQLTMTVEPAKALAGLIAEIGPRVILSRLSESATRLPYGIAVKMGADKDNGFLPLAGSGDEVLGILGHAHFLNTKGIAEQTQPIGQKDAVNVVAMGVVNVLVEEAVAPGDPVYVRYTATSPNPQVGSFRKSADTGKAKLLRGARYLTTAGAGGFAQVWFVGPSEAAAIDVAAIEAEIGNLASLTTTDKSTLVAAINVVDADLELVVKTADLAAVTNAKGAALVGVEDAAALLTAADVEAALAELAKYAAIELADPGTAAAIPVTRSATVPLVIADDAETNTLAVPTFLGQRLNLFARSRAGTGSRVVTVAGVVNVANNNTITFDAESEFISLVAVRAAGGTLVWQVDGVDGAGVSTV